MGTLQETNPSLWVSTTEPGDFPALDGDARADVVVLGAGITGLTTARLLTERGASVVVVDAGPVCAGATGYTTAKITSLHGVLYTDIAARFDEERARGYGEANEAAIATVARLVADDGIDCGFERRAHVVYTTDPDRVADVRAEADLAARLGLPATFTVPDELPFDVAGAVRFEDQAQFHPRAYCLALARSIVDRGGRVCAHTRARDVERAGGDVRVETDRGTVTGGAVVVATHLPFKEMGGFFARSEPQRSYAVAVTLDGVRPEDMYISADSPTRSLRTAGEHLIVGGEDHKVGDAHDTRQHYAALEAWARDRFAVRDVTHRWSAQDWRAADGLPYVGRMPGMGDHVFVATAFRKWGMSNGTAAAMILADLVAGRENPWLAVFDATRLAPAQSIRGVVSENVAVAKHFVGDRLAAHRPPDADTLAPGDGAIVEVDGQRVAGFRDETGTLHSVSPVCTHLGCLVAFNPAERSWDCPCHGSRFTVDGAVLEGPAVADLPPVP